MPDNRIQVDEASPTQQAIYFVLTGRMSSHQPLDGRWFVRRVVVDVESVTGFPPSHGVVDEAFECRLLLCKCEGPNRLVLRSSRFIQRHNSEQILQPAITDESSSLEIEEHVYRSRLWKTIQTPSFLKRQ